MVDQVLGSADLCLTGWDPGWVGRSASPGGGGGSGGWEGVIPPPACGSGAVGCEAVTNGLASRATADDDGSTGRAGPSDDGPTGWLPTKGAAPSQPQPHPGEENRSNGRSTRGRSGSVVGRRILVGSREDCGGFR